MNIGRIYPKDTLFLRHGIGAAKNEQGAYELSTNVAGQLPIVRSPITGKWWTLTWEEVVKLAVDAGVDKI